MISCCCDQPPPAPPNPSTDPAATMAGPTHFRTLKCDRRRVFGGVWVWGMGRIGGEGSVESSSSERAASSSLVASLHSLVGDREAAAGRGRSPQSPWWAVFVCLCHAWPQARLTSHTRSTHTHPDRQAGLGFDRFQTRPVIKSSNTLPAASRSSEQSAATQWASKSSQQAQAKAQPSPPSHQNGGR